MPSFTKSITIDRAPEQVFAVLDDLEGAKRWMPSIRRIDVLTPGMAMGPGFKWRETRRVLGILRVKVVLTVIRHERPSGWALMFNDGKVQATATFDLAPAGAGTRVTFTEEVEDLRGEGRRAERMLRAMERQDATLLQRLKAYVESTTEPPARRGPDRASAAEATGDAEPAAAPAPAKPPKAPRKAAKAASPRPKKASAKKPK